MRSNYTGIDRLFAISPRSTIAPKEERYLFELMAFMRQPWTSSEPAPFIFVRPIGGGGNASGWKRYTAPVSMVGQHHVWQLHLDSNVTSRDLEWYATLRNLSYPAEAADGPVTVTVVVVRHARERGI
jgi:hypothetical protein